MNDAAHPSAGTSGQTEPLAWSVPVSRRRLFALAGGAAAVAALAACGSDNSSTSATTAGGTATTAGGAGTTVASGATTAAASATTAPAAKPGGTLRVGTGSAPTSLDPHAGSSGNDYILLYPLYDTLIDFDPTTLQPKPGLAESWSFDSATSFTLKLRSGVTFHDGTPLDAAAVKYSLTRAQSDPVSNIKTDLAAITAIDVVDPATVRLTLNRADSEIVGILSDRAGMIVSPTAAQKLGKDFGTGPVGAGPFKFKSYQQGATASYVKNTSYWRSGLPYLDGIELSIVPQSATRLNALLSGDSDFDYRLDADQIAQVEGQDAVTYLKYVGIGNCKVIYMDTSLPPFDKKEVRQAVNYAFDREAMANAATFNTGEPMWMVFPKAHWAYRPNLVPTFPHDLQKAKDLLAQAGLANGVTFTICHQTDATDTRVAELIQSQLKEAGITAELHPVELTQSVTDYFVNKKYNAGSFGWTGRPDPNMTFRQVYSSTAYFNAGKYPIPGFDDLMNQASSVSAIPDRQAVYDKVVPLVDDHAITAPLFWYASIDGFSKKLVNYVPNLLAKPKFTEVSFKS